MFHPRDPFQRSWVFFFWFFFLFFFLITAGFWQHGVLVSDKFFFFFFLFFLNVMNSNFLIYSTILFWRFQMASSMSQSLLDYSTTLGVQHCLLCPERTPRSWQKDAETLANARLWLFLGIGRYLTLIIQVRGFAKEACTHRPPSSPVCILGG